MKKIIITSLIFALFVAIAIMVFPIRDRDKSIKDATTKAVESSASTTKISTNRTAAVEDASNSITATNPITMQSFTYNLKNDYSSRSEILEEKNALEIAYLSYCGAHDSTAADEAAIVFRSCVDVLDKKLEKYPASAAEMESQKVNEFDQLLEIVRLNLQSAQSERQAFPNDAQYQVKFDRRKQSYEDALEIQKEYQEGLISIQKAIDRVKRLLALESILE